MNLAYRPGMPYDVCYCTVQLALYKLVESRPGTWNEPEFTINPVLGSDFFICQAEDLETVVDPSMALKVDVGKAKVFIY